MGERYTHADLVTAVAFETLQFLEHVQSQQMIGIPTGHSTSAQLLFNIPLGLQGGTGNDFRECSRTLGDLTQTEVAYLSRLSVD